MKKYILAAMALLVIIGLQSCLKDKGYENQEYGIQGQDIVAVSLAEGPNSPILSSINATTSPQTLVTNVALESSEPAKSDIVVQLVSNNTIVANEGLQGMPAGSYTMPSSVTIKAGTKLTPINIVIPNSTILDLTKTYGIGISIASVIPAGINIATNIKDLVLGFAIKNKYDGKYTLKGVHNRTPYTFPYNFKVEMRTTSANSVAMYLTAPYNDYGHVIGTAPGVVSWYGNTLAPVFSFDVATNNCTGIGLYSGTAVTVAMVTTGGIVNRYVPAAGSTPSTMYLTWQYNGNDLRRFYDTLIYTGPR